MSMREEFEKWCAKNEANQNNYYFSEGWKAAWHARDAEIEALKAKHAALIEALRVVGPMKPVRFLYSTAGINGNGEPRNESELNEAIETINAAIRGRE